MDEVNSNTAADLFSSLSIIINSIVSLSLSRSFCSCVQIQLLVPSTSHIYLGQRSKRSTLSISCSGDDDAQIEIHTLLELLSFLLFPLRLAERCGFYWASFWATNVSIDMNRSKAARTLLWNISFYLTIWAREQRTVYNIWNTGDNDDAILDSKQWRAKRDGSGSNRTFFSLHVKSTLDCMCKRDSRTVIMFTIISGRKRHQRNRKSFQ